MVPPSDKKQTIINRLQTDILRWQGFVSAETPAAPIGLGPMEHAFPNAVFPRGSIHEFVCTSVEQTAASSGFISGILAALMGQGGVCLWISTSRSLFPPALKTFNVTPDLVIFITVNGEKEMRWALEEALKCEGLAAVVAESNRLDFVQSRRLQLAVEKSRVTGFILRSEPARVGTTACTARWQVSPLPSQLEPGLPGVGFPRWQVHLLKVRNGLMIVFLTLPII